MPDSTARRERARPLSPEERRAAIVEATVALVMEHGATVTSRLVAEAAGVAEGTIFRVFPDMRALFHAVAEHVMNPPGSTNEMADQIADLDDLHDKVVRVATRLEERSYRVMRVMMALRQIWMNDGPPAKEQGPPAFVVKAQQALLDNLTHVLFAPHADQLRTSPEEAAIALRALVLGSRHPGVQGDERRLTPEQMADVVLRGVEKGGH
jgi:AcrR family transcriptional regulator